MKRKTTMLLVVGLLVLVMIATVFFTLPSSGEIEGVTNLTTSEAAKIVEENQGKADFAIIDVRTPSEFAVGHLPGAINIDFRTATFEKELAKLDRNKSYLVYCRTGRRSKDSLPVFGRLGFTKILHLTKGITDWMSSGHPVVPAAAK